MAHIGNVQLGVTTMEQLEAMFGPGRAFTGGHPRGAREWRSTRTGWYIYADGFEYKGAGTKERMVESFEISVRRQAVGGSDDTDLKIHPAAVSRDQLTILGGITPGMERAKVLTLLGQAGVKTRTGANVIVWQEKGHDQIRAATPNSAGLSYSIWNGKLTFRHDKLTDISIDCE